MKLKVSDLVVNTKGASQGNSYDQLKPGQVVDVQWYDYVDFLIAPAIRSSMAQAASLKAQGARIEGLPSAQPAIRLWEMDGMVTKVDQANTQIFPDLQVRGEPDRPSPDAGEVIQMPRIVSPERQGGDGVAQAGRPSRLRLQPADLL